MPRDGSQQYHVPAGTDGVINYTIESTKYNAFIHDVEADLNAPRPIAAGGTGASSADAALINLSGEKATQIITNYDSQIWLPGSFMSSNTTGQAAPVDGHAFAGICYLGEPLTNPPTNQNLVIEARDLDSPIQPGQLYTRQKKAGIWSPWSITSTGTDQAATRQTIYAAPFDALAYNGMQINGSMDVSQERGYSAASVTNTWACDGWVFSFTGTMAAISGPANNILMFPGLQNILVTAVTTAQASLGAGDLLNVAQKIEGYRLARLAWGTASAQSLTIGFWTNHHLVGTYCVSFRNPSTTRSYVATYTQNVADTSEYKTITVPGCTNGTWPIDNTIGMYINFSFACGTTYQGASANTWLTTNSIAVAGQVNGAASTSNIFRITGVVVLPGIEAPSAARSPLIMRPYDQELITCRRYFYNGVPPLRGLISSNGLSANRLAAYHPVPMRATPAATITSPLQVLDGSGSAAIPNVSSLWTTATVLEFDAALSAALTAARSAIVYQGGGNINVDARL